MFALTMMIRIWILFICMLIIKFNVNFLILDLNIELLCP